MKHTLALLGALGVVAALTAPALAQTAPGAPPPGTQTANLLFQAQIAASRVATASPQNAQSAAIAYQQALQSYRAGDIPAARAQALNVVMNANGYTAQNPTLLTPQAPTSAYPVHVFPLTGDTAKIDADAFIANAREAVDSCVVANDPATPQAMAALDTAQRADNKGDYNSARSQARVAVDLCASVRR
jgi:hypothetical protein